MSRRRWYGRMISALAVKKETGSSSSKSCCSYLRRLESDSAKKKIVSEKERTRKNGKLF
jgi:hypothetical protein